MNIYRQQPFFYPAPQSAVIKNFNTAASVLSLSEIFDTIPINSLYPAFLTGAVNAYFNEPAAKSPAVPVNGQKLLAPRLSDESRDALNASQIPNITQIPGFNRISKTVLPIFPLPRQYTKMPNGVSKNSQPINKSADNTVYEKNISLPPQKKKRRLSDPRLIKSVFGASQHITGPERITDITPLHLSRLREVTGNTHSLQTHAVAPILRTNPFNHLRLLNCRSQTDLKTCSEIESKIGSEIYSQTGLTINPKIGFNIDPKTINPVFTNVNFVFPSAISSRAETDSEKFRHVCEQASYGGNLDSAPVKTYVSSAYSPYSLNAANTQRFPHDATVFSADSTSLYEKNAITLRNPDVIEPNRIKSSLKAPYYPTNSEAENTLSAPNPTAESKEKAKRTFFPAESVYTKQAQFIGGEIFFLNNFTAPLTEKSFFLTENAVSESKTTLTENEILTITANGDELSETPVKDNIIQTIAVQNVRDDKKKSDIFEKFSQKELLEDILAALAEAFAETAAVSTEGFHD